MPSVQHHRWIGAAAMLASVAAAIAHLPRLAAGLRMRADRAHAKAWLDLFAIALAVGLSCASAVQAATPANTVITNTATATFKLSGVPIQVSGSASVTTSAATPATIELMGYASAAQGRPGWSSAQYVQPVQCSRGGSWVALPLPAMPGAGPMALPGTYAFAQTNMYASGDAVFVRVTDHDQNRDPARVETLEVKVSSGHGDTELLRLNETGPSTGIFVGYVQSAAGAAQPGNCVLDTGAGERVLATYIDDSEGQLAVSAAALIDPFGRVFDSSSGQPVSGARITLIDVATGQPATVRGNDGVSSYPSTVVSGATVTDGGGTVYSFAPGHYQFPRLAPGNYRFAVEPPPGFRFPSVVADPVLRALPGAPFSLPQGARGEVFPLVPGPALEIDIPVDPGPLGELNILKSAGKSVAAIGDFVPYTVSIGNRGGNALDSVVIADRLPQGFRYQKGSARLNDLPLTDPRIGADGRSLQFELGAIAADASVTLRYVTAVEAGARIGLAENVAQSVGRVSSNVARASLFVRDELQRRRAILAGRVTMAQSCDGTEGNAAAVGLPGVRVLLEDGTFIVTDAEGNWHADNIRPGTHVVQLDTTSLPPGVELRNCDRSSRTGGRHFSQLVNVRGGTLWRADFRLVRTPSCVTQQLVRRGQRIELHLGAAVAVDAVTATVMLPEGTTAAAGKFELDGRAYGGVQAGDGFLVLRLPAQRAKWRHVLSLELQGAAAGEVKAGVRVQPVGQAMASLQPLVLAAQAREARACAPLPAASSQGGTAPAGDTGPGALVSAPAAEGTQLSLVEKLPYDDKWLAAAAPGNEWLHPQAGFVPALPVVKVALKHARGSKAELKVNGSAVDPLRYEGTVLSPNGEWMLSNWRAVDLRDGANAIDVVLRNEQGTVLLQESRTIHYTVAPSRAEFDAARSQLVADGRTSPVIAVRMLDANGRPVRRGVSGEFELNAPYLSQQQADALQRDPLTGNLGGRSKYQIGEDGIALIALQPTTQSGEVVLRFPLADRRSEEVRAWLDPELREWVLVGFAEGSVGHKRLSGNMESLQDSDEERLFDRNRIAFYAKGQVRGEYLLTMAFDSAKERSTGPQAAVLKQLINPAQYYTLYADATQPQFDAASTRKLYLKIEKSRFYALFGDYDTGLTVTELGRYSRTLTGLKSEFKGDTLAYNVFAARTSQSFGKDELQGDGTSGLYRLRGRNLLLNSEKVRIEVRDRFQPTRVLSTRTMTPYLDYQLDPVLGTLFFREPVASRDEALNPVFIVVEYETDDRGAETWTYGGRVAARVGKQAEVGVTRIHEGTSGREATLTAADATVRFGDTTRLRAEVATSERNTAVGSESGQAWLAEFTHDDGKTAVRAHASQQDPGFGLGQQAGSAEGRRNIGAEGRVKLSDQLQLQAQTYRQQDLRSGGRRDVLEGRADWTDKEGLSLTGGLRAASERDSAGNESDARQVTGGVAWETMDRRLVLRASTDLDVGSRGTVNFPNRLVLGADYRITPATTVFATQEFARGDQLRANTTRAGLRTQLWEGAEVQGGIGNQGTLDANRLYATTGLVQKLRIDEHWTADAGIDRVQTLRSRTNPLGPEQPLASGTPPLASYGIVTGDYTAVSLGLAYRDALWTGNARAEWRTSDTDKKLNLLLGAQRQLGQGRVVAAALAFLDSRGTAEARNVNARLSYAARPNHSKWMWLEKLEYVEDKTSALASRVATRKLINNLNANWKDQRTQLSLQYSAKYVRELIGDTRHSGFTDLAGLEVRRDIGARWDAGVHASVLHSWRSGSRQKQVGASVGYLVAENTWIAVGYNQSGFRDPDFSGADYRRKGVYVALRAKFDQDTFRLNDGGNAQAPLKF